MSGSDNCFDVLGDFIMVGYVYEWLSNGVIQTAIVLVACSSSWRKTRTGELALHMHVRPLALQTGKTSRLNLQIPGSMRNGIELTLVLAGRRRSGSSRVCFTAGETYTRL
jgi:hypothetical protein